MKQMPKEKVLKSSVNSNRGLQLLNCFLRIKHLVSHCITVVTKRLYSVGCTDNVFCSSRCVVIVKSLVVNRIHKINGENSGM